MRNHLLVFLVVLIFSTSFNQGERLKSNDRRASGLMAYPRIGRSDLPVSNVNFNRRHDMELDTNYQLYNSDDDSAPDKDYEEPRNLAPGYLGRSINIKNTDKMPKEVSWLIPDRLRSSKDYRSWQTNDDARTPYSNSLPSVTGSRNSQINGYTPRLGRENDIQRTLCK